jgi:hypothetical protein
MSRKTAPKKISVSEKGFFLGGGISNNNIIYAKAVTVLRIRYLQISHP